MFYYLIAPFVLTRQESYAFTYKSSQRIEPGCLVKISVGNKVALGLLLEEVSRPAFVTKVILEQITTQPLPPQLIATTIWQSKHYSTHLSQILKTIAPKNIQTRARKLHSKPLSPNRDRTKIVLNDEQRETLQKIEQQKEGTFILDGVTGSGKTNVYIEAARKSIDEGRSVILLVPEIALTSQLVAEFNNHFANIILTHSTMTQGARRQIWQDLLKEMSPVILIGPRSALFMPVSNVGLIILDESHDASYYQEQSPKYHAQRIASKLAQEHHAKLILGSATHTVAEYYIAEQKGVTFLHLSKPARNVIPPDIQIVDIKQRTNFREHRFISDPLLAATRLALHNQKQILFFHNRRGTASTTLCENCGWIANCPNCGIPLTHHADKFALLCHQCGHKQNLPPACPVCKNPSIVFKGLGTKLIETSIKKMFPKARIARFDGDNTKDETLDKRYQELYDGSIDIVIGTQTLTKGLDLPHLSVVGVLQADSGLLLPDYTSEERTYQLLKQVIGRVGRTANKSTVIVQTYQPQHPVIQLAAHEGYKSLYHYVLAERKKFVFPPFSYLLKLTCSYKTERSAINASLKLASELRKVKEISVLGPAPSFYEKIGQNYRWQLLVKSKKRFILQEIALKAGPKWHPEIDPINMLN